jgi:hypothetical protein
VLILWHRPPRHWAMREDGHAGTLDLHARQSKFRPKIAGMRSVPGEQVVINVGSHAAIRSLLGIEADVEAAKIVFLSALTSRVCIPSRPLSSPQCVAASGAKSTPRCGPL